MRLRLFTWRPDEKTNFTFLSYFQNEPETGYYGWLPKEERLNRYRMVNACRQISMKGVKQHLFS